MMTEMKYEVIKTLSILSENDQGYTKKLVLVKWFDRKPVYELRTFDPDGVPKKRCGLTQEELEKMIAALSEWKEK